MNTTPRTIPEYLAQLRVALGDADPALLQDALYDAEEYLRSELAENPGKDEAAVIASIAGSYGAPQEVADIYRDTEVRVARALRPPKVAARSSTLGRFFAVAADPRAYAALFYMLLSLATGIFYFTWAVTGMSLSAGLMVLIIGVPFALLFLGTVRVLALVEGRLVEVMLGERMPRRPTYAQRGVPLLQRIAGMLKDPRTWSTLFYMLLMLPLGIAYFTLAVAALSVSVGLVAGSVLQLAESAGLLRTGATFATPVALAPLILLGGIVLFFTTLHVARTIGRVHGQLAKLLLVKPERADTSEAAAV